MLASYGGSKLGTITAQALINSAAFILQDAANTTWTRAELLAIANDAQRAVCLIKPDAYTRNLAVQLVAGTKQSIPADGHSFVRLARNMGAAGTAPGRVPRQIPLATMDMQNPGWHSAATGTVVMEYVYDDRDPRTYYVSPPQPASGMHFVDQVYYGIPADMTTETGSTGIIAIDDIYKTALVEMMLFFAYMKEAERQNPAAANAHRDEALLLLGAKNKSETQEPV
jgi:hypothetical protein